MTLAEIQLRRILSEYERECRPDASAENLCYVLAASILKEFLGPQWVVDNVFGGKPMDEFLRPNSSIPADGFRFLQRVENLAEQLFNFQAIRGVEAPLAKLQTSGIETVVPELQAAKMLCQSNISFHFVAESGQKGRDFDIVAFTRDYQPVHCEVECKRETTPLGEQTLLSALDKARRQLPRGNPGLIFIRIPEPWTAMPDCGTVVSSVTRRFFSNRNTRVIAFVLFWERWVHSADPEGPAAHTELFRRVPHPRTAFPTVRDDLLGRFRIADPVTGIVAPTSWRYIGPIVNDYMSWAHNRTARPDA